MQPMLSKTLFQLPSVFPRKKILSIDIGGTLAKVAFYIPKDDANIKIPEYHEKLTKSSIPSMHIFTMIIILPECHFFTPFL